MSGTDKRRGGVSVRCSKESKAILKKYAQGKSGKIPEERISMKMILDLVIPKIVEYDLHDPDWIDKLKAADKTTELLARLGDECPGLAYGLDTADKEVYRCIWYRMDGPPKIKILGRTESLQRSACASCDRTRKIVKGILDRDEEIKRLRERVGKGVKLKLPQCNAGGILQSDGSRFWCGRQYGSGYMTVEKCIKRECTALKWTHLDMKGKLPDPERGR